MRVPQGEYTTEIVVRRSRFIAHVEPFADPALVKESVGAVRAAHPGCSHVVWAFCCGPAGETEGMSDDHEPHGTAGRPVLDVIRGNEVTNLLVTVTRYFGGTKLGTGGLVRAYSESARSALAGVELAELVPRRAFTLILPYESYESVRRAMEELGVLTANEEFTDRVVITASVPERVAALLAERVRNLTLGASEPEFAEPDNP